MRIRRAKSSDIGQIYRLGSKDFKKEEWFTKKIILNLIRFSPGLCWVLEDKGKIIGARLFLENCGKKTVWGWLVIIEKHHRHHHLGTLLFEKTCQELRKLGFRRILTDVEADNKISINWHKKVGYKRIGRVRDWFDEGVDAIIFKKDI
jgi:L-amino acid N-acyltransferase YncA